MVSIIVGTAVAGLLFLAVVFFMARGMKWRSYQFSFGREAESPADVLARWANSPTAWSLAFVLLVVGTMAVALGALGALPVPVPGGMAAVAIIVAVILLVALVLGTFTYMRSIDRSTSEAAVISLMVLGGLFVLFLSANLVFGLLGGG